MSASKRNFLLRKSWLWMLVMFGIKGCLPIPDVQVDLDVAPPHYFTALEDVHVEYLLTEGYEAPGTPEEYNASAYLRYSLVDEPNTILLLMPGIFGGAASFDEFARQLVASTPDVEVWAIDRRANLLEDRSAIIASLERDDPLIAYEYYVELWGREGGFELLQAQDVPFLRNWGLEVHLRDLHLLVEKARERAPNVILGGHSLGASLVSFYAAFDLGAQAIPRYGYEYLDGLVLLDGGLGRTGGYGRGDVGVGFGPIRFAPTVRELEEGVGQPYVTSIISPRYQIEREVTALHALLRPDALAPPGLTDLPITNRALVGVRNDDEYGPVPIFSSSLGHAENAEFDGNLGAVILGGLEGLRSRSVVGAAPGADFITWAPGDPQRERTDISTFIRTWTLPQTNFSEWYFPVRLGLDMTLLDAELEDTPGFLPNRLVTVPTLSLGASRGLVTSLEGMRSYANIRYGSAITANVLPGLTHIDILLARSNPAVPILQRWIRFFTD